MGSTTVSEPFQTQWNLHGYDTARARQFPTDDFRMMQLKTCSTKLFYDTALWNNHELTFFLPSSQSRAPNVVVANLVVNQDAVYFSLLVAVTNENASQSPARENIW